MNRGAHRPRLLLNTLAGCLFLCAHALRAEPVLVQQGKSFGNGYTVTNGESCSVVTAEHVVQELDEPIRVSDARRTSADARITRKGSWIGRDASSPDTSIIRNMDVAVAKIQDGSSIECTARWEDGVNAESLLGGTNQGAQELVVPRVLEEGSIKRQRLFVRETGSEKLLFEARSEQDKFMQGDSGSFVTFSQGGTTWLVGMITEVDTDKGVITAIPQKWLHSLIGAFVTRTSRIPAGVRMAPAKAGVNLPGNDYRFETPDTAAECEQYCAEDNRCRSYTFVNAGAQAVTAMCWLKNATPAAFAAGHTTSGVKQQGPVATIATDPEVLRGTWEDEGYPSNFARFTQEGRNFRFTRSGQFSGNGERFDVTGFGTLEGRILTVEYAATYSTGAKSKGNCAGDLLEGPQHSMHLAMRCTDSRLGGFATLATRKR